MRTCSNRSRPRHWLCSIITTFTIIVVAPPGFAQMPPGGDLLEQQIVSATGGTGSITRDPVTGQATFLRTQRGQPLRQPFNGGRSGDAKQTAANFLSAYGELFGLRDANADLRLARITAVSNGRTVLRYTQENGLPVFAAELIIQLDKDLNVLSVNGHVAAVGEQDQLRAAEKPAVGIAGAARAAIAMVAKKYHAPAKQLTAGDADAWLFNPAVVHTGNSRNSVVWKLEVGDRTGNIRELVLVDASSGVPVYHYSLIHQARDRNTYDNQNNPAFGLPGNGPVRSEGDGPSAVPEVNNAHDYAGNTYDFYADVHGRDSLDDAGMPLVSTVRYCPSGQDCPYQNAFWNGAQMAYGDGFAAADDVVAHELTHGVTEFSSGLIYQDQSGAINESFSDVWGEFIDLGNGAGTDTAATRWLIGEDIPQIGAIRDMENPPAFGDPDRIGSSNYYCGSSDSGGVHTNSGVNNKAAYLMVDGGSFNGHDVTGIGITKTAKVYYEAQTNLLTPSSTYLDLFNAMQAACSALIGSDGIVADDCQQVLAAITAVEMDVAACVIEPAPVCDDGSEPNDLYIEDFESGLGAWGHTALTGPDAWALSTTNPGSGSQHLHGDDAAVTSDSVALMLQGVTLPANAYLHFEHDFDIEYGWDGGVVMFSVDGAASWVDAGPLFSHNGYTLTLAASDNPLAGAEAMTGSSGGYSSSRLDLSSLAGQNVQFMYRIGTDATVGAQGWDIDNVRIYTCGEVGGTPEITSPSPGSVLAGNSETFNWSGNGITATGWGLFLGSTSGAADIYSSGILPANANTAGVTGIPVDGRTVYARLWYNTAGAWNFVDTTYIAANQIPAIQTPVPGSTLSGTTVTFEWNDNGASLDATGLFIGTSVGSADIHSSGVLDGTVRSEVVSGLPADGSTVFARLWYNINGAWVYQDYTYAAFDAEALPEITSPANGSTLPGADLSFSWSSNGQVVDKYWLQIGTAIGGKDLYSSGNLDSATSVEVTGLPTDGSTVYARLWYYIGASPSLQAGSWYYDDYSYTAASEGSTVGFDEQFAGDISNWVQDAGNWVNDQAQYLYGTGVGITPPGWISSSYGPAVYGDLDITVRLKRSDDNASDVWAANNVFIRWDGAMGSDNGCNSCYMFQYSGIGEIGVFKMVNGVVGVLQNWVVPPGVVNTGDQWNLLRVVAQGDSLAFYVNGNLVWSGTDSDLSVGGVGVSAVKFETINFRADYATLTVPTAALSFDPVSAQQQRLNEVANAVGGGADPMRGATSAGH